MLRFCANLGFLFTEVPFLDRFAAAARAGFTGVEYASPYEYPAAELKSRLADNGLTQVLINTWPGNRAAGERGFACVQGKEGAFRDSIGQALDYAAALGCKQIHVIAGVPPSGLAWDTAAALYANNLAWAAERAHAAGIKLLLEPLNPRDAPGYFLSSQEQGAAIVEAIGRDRLALQFDTYHCQIAQGDLATRLAKLMPVIGHIQIASIPSRNEPDGEELNYPFLFDELDRLGYAGFVGCEYNPRGKTTDGLAWFRPYAGVKP